MSKYLLSKLKIISLQININDILSWKITVFSKTKFSEKNGILQISLMSGLIETAGFSTCFWI